MYSNYFFLWKIRLIVFFFVLLQLLTHTGPHSLIVGEAIEGVLHLGMRR